MLAEARREYDGGLGLFEFYSGVNTIGGTSHRERKFFPVSLERQYQRLSAFILDCHAAADCVLQAVLLLLYSAVRLIYKDVKTLTVVPIQVGTMEIVRV